MRNLLYVAKEYEKLIVGESIYSSKLIKLPFPKFIVFYNGTDEQPERLELKLSDAYYLSEEYKTESLQPELELKVMVLNINLGNNKELLEACQTLKEYVIYVEMVRNYAKCMSLDEAVDCAINECIDKGILKDFLLRFKAEAKSMSIFEYDEEKELALYRKAEREVAREEALKEGREEGLKAIVASLKPLLPDFDSVYNAIIANELYANVSKEEVRKYYK